MKSLVLLLIILLTSFVLFAKEKQPKQYREMILEDFMEDYIKQASKQADRGFDEQLRQTLKLVPDMALADEKEDWKSIVEKALKTKDYERSCKSCHKKYKKTYHKTYNKRLVKVPRELNRIFGY